MTFSKIEYSNMDIIINIKKNTDFDQNNIITNDLINNTDFDPNNIITSDLIKNTDFDPNNIYICLPDICDNKSKHYLNIQNIIFDIFKKYEIVSNGNIKKKRRFKKIIKI